MIAGKRILYVYSGKARPAGAGLDMVVRQQVQALVDAGCKVTFVSRGRFEHPLVRNVTFRITPAHIFSSLPSRYYYNAQNRFFSMLGSWLVSRGKFDLVIGWSRQSRALFRRANQCGIPCYLNCTISYFRADPARDASSYCWPHTGDQYLDEEYRRADTLLLPSEFARESFLAFGFSERSAVYIGRGADIARFSFQPRPAQPFRVVFLGLVCERKGIAEALEAWREAKIDNGEFWVVGHVVEEMKACLENALPEGVVVKGFSKTPEVWLQQCHVQILPTRLEGMAKSLVEGAACGLVTVTTRESGFPVVEEETGFYVGRENIRQMSARLRFLADNPAELQRMARKSSEFVGSNLTWPIFRNRFIAALSKPDEKEKP